MPGHACGYEPAQVLLVDGPADQREILRTVLERRGWRILEADEPQRGLELARRHQPRVVVLDLESSSAATAQQALGDEVKDHAAQLVILGNLRRDFTAPSGEHFVAKPYHYAALVRTIERLFQESVQTKAG